MYNFSNSYNRNNFVGFLENNFLPEDFEQKEETLNLNFIPKFTSSVTRLGACKSLGLEVFEVEHNSTHDARVGISRDAFQIMQKNSYCNKALVAFIPKGSNQYRFSFLQIEAEQKDHSARIQRNYSNPRRYSYLLGEGIGGYTPNKFLLAKGRIKDSKDLAERFSVEVLTKAFYGELSDWYAWAIKNVQFPGEYEMETEEKRIEHRSKNVIRLLTRLLFVWFLKQKNLIPTELFDVEFLNNKLLKEFDPNQKTGLFAHKSFESKYYKAILQNLFFATLNCPITPQSKEDTRTRGFRKNDWYGQGFGSDHLMRYEELFLNPQLFLELVNTKVPFLNGGLFDCLDDKQNKIYIDGFSDNLIKPNLLIVPDFLFFGEKKGEDLSDFYGDRKKKSVDAIGLIDILQKYNFTIEENTPFDQEVSLDPELLGKVFENLLASYNPETKTTARKQTGSFYTPREIVQYMVDESLIAYLKQSVGEEYEEEYRKLMQYADVTLNINDDIKRAIIQSIQKCKVLDPACGSGAFPVGVLQQMVHVLSQLDPQNEIWKNLILEESVKELSSTLKDYTNEEREEIQTDINRSFDDNINRPDYARKLYLIERCIYGVDIQSIAVQISKLRFFISLVVDQCPTHNQKENFGIRPLPNLEAKFVAANTLIGLSKTKTLFDSPEVEKLQEKLNQTNHRIFGAKSNKSKNKYKARVEELQTQITEKLKGLGVVGNDDARLMQQWKMFDQNASSPFFDPEWMFGLKSRASNQDGYFDIVIGNPPWGAKLTLEEKTMFKTVYSEIDSSTPNSFAYFVGWAYKNYSCIISFVLPDSILIKDYAKTRKLIKNELSEIIWYENSGVPKDIKPFVYVDHDICIINISKSVYKDLKYSLYRYKKNSGKLIEESYTQEKTKIIIEEYEYAFNLIAREEDFSILDKIRLFPQLEKMTQCHEGIHTGNCREKLFLNQQKNNYCKPLFYGGGAGDAIYNYYSKRNGWFVDYRMEIIDKYQGDYASLRNKNIFVLPKIYITRTGNPFKAFFDTTNYASNNFFSLQHINYSENTVPFLKYILPFIISKPAQYFIRKFAAPRIGSTFVETKIFHLLKFRIPILSDNERLPFIKLVDEIISKKQKDIDADVAALEMEINKLVYKAYNLTKEEIEIIENN
jgi:predicted RNA methylase